MNAVVGSEQAKTKVRDSTVAQFYFPHLTTTKQTNVDPEPTGSSTGARGSPIKLLQKAMPSGRTLETKAHRLGLSPSSVLRLRKHEVLQGLHQQENLLHTEVDSHLEQGTVFSSQTAKREGK